MKNEDDLRPVNPTHTKPLDKAIDELKKTLPETKKSKWGLFHVMLMSGGPDPEAEFPDPDVVAEEHVSELYIDVTNVTSFFKCIDGNTLIETPFEGFKVTDTIEYVLSQMPE